MAAADLDYIHNTSESNQKKELIAQLAGGAA
jgi:hypothetical protein